MVPLRKWLFLYLCKTRTKTEPNYAERIQVLEDFAIFRVFFYFFMI